MINDNLLKSLKDYIQKKDVDGAFYIDGQWGSGKTFFINDFMENYNKGLEKPECYYVSLMGLTSIDEITKELFALCHPIINSIKNGPIAKCLVTMGKIAANTVGVANDSIDDAISNFTSLFKNHQVRVLVLDDFERSRIDLQELFGYITSLIQINDVRIILIGNDNEVRRYLQEESIYRQKVIASNISKDLKDFTDNIKSLEEPLLYDSIKEKCVYKTYHFVTDRDIIFNSLIICFPKSVQKLIRKYRKTIEWILNKYCCNNLRTLKAAVENYQFIINSLHKSFDNDVFIKSRILLSCFAYTVLLKEGRNEDEFGSTMYQGNERIYPIKPVCDYVFRTSWNRDALISSLNVVDKEKSTELSNSIPVSYRRLSCNWFEKTDEQLKQEIAEVAKDLDSFPFNTYYPLIHYFYTYKQWFPSDDTIVLEKIMAQMIANVNKSTKEIESLDEYMFFEPTEEALPYFRKLEDSIKKHNKIVQNRELKLFSKSLKTYSIDDLDRIEHKAFEYRSFFASLNIDELLNTIEAGTSSDIVELRRFINSIYKISNLKNFFENDLPNLKMFRDRLENITVDSVIKNKNIDYLKQDLDKYILNLSGD